MPLSGGKYVAPHWVNNAAPALDADELQAMCDTIVKNQTEAGKISGLQYAISGKARAQVVSYVGTGTYGESNPCSITASFPIQVAIMLGRRYNSGPPNYGVEDRTNVVTSMLTGQFRNGLGFHSGDTYKVYAKISNGDRTITWYNTISEQAQFNNVAFTYYVLCIG